jgi:hypothetical protein
MAVRPGFEILVTHPVDQGPQLVEIHGELSDWTLACSIDATSTATSCESPRSLQEASDYELVLEFANGDTSWSEFSTRIPSSGKAFDLGYNASLTTLGRDDSAAQILDSLITSWDLVVVQTAEPSLSDALLMGPASLTVEGTYRIGNPGLTTVLALREGGGEMLQTLPTDVLLPIPASNETIALPIRNLAFQGSPEQDGLQYTLTGFLEPAAMDLLSEAFGDTPNLLSMLVVLDHDLDGDGVLDAASLELVGWSPSVTLGAWSNE